MKRPFDVNLVILPPLSERLVALELVRAKTSCQNRHLRLWRCTWLKEPLCPFDCDIAVNIGYVLDKSYNVGGF